MDSKSFEQVSVGKDIIGDDENILKENMDVKIEFYEEKPLIITLPKSADYEILETSKEYFISMEDEEIKSELFLEANLLFPNFGKTKDST